MTLDEMKLAVCEKLTAKIFRYLDGRLCWRDSDKVINWPTEGLQVCHEAEKELSAEINRDGGSRMPWYYEQVNRVCQRDNFPPQRAAYEQRLEALCRVWYPERFPR